uniref:MULE transposase domain-containing protein n=1 Tax=Daphnia galeata TaxID=27404 RepID=A0A8J2RNP6_9CRUS|nr:unnamed protein product [Daphnia galeata]
MEIAVERIAGIRHGSFIYKSEDNYLFHLYKERTYRCRKSKPSHTGCLARLNQTGDSYRMTGEHNHPSEEEEIRRLAVRTECKEQAATQPERPKAIFESVRQRHPDAVIGYNPALERAMQRSKRRVQPPIPHSLDEAEALLNDSPTYRRTLYGEAEFFKGRLSTATGTAFMFISMAILPLIRTTKEIHADGTFQVVPDLFYQLLTIQVMAYGRAFPVAYVLMTEKTAELYNLVMQRFLEVVRETVPGEGFQVELCVSDFEEAILGSMHRAFPLARSRGCWFHFGQAIYRKACEIGLQALYKTNATVKRIVQLLIALALLPAERAYQAFQEIQQRNADALLSEAPEIRAMILQLYQYMGGYWFTVQGPQRFSVHGDTWRTNNNVESFNRWFNARCGGNRSNFWSFIRHLQDCDASWTRDLQAEQAGQETARPQTAKNRRRDARIARLTQDLQANRLQDYEFLQLTSSMFEPDRVPTRVRRAATNPVAQQQPVEQLEDPPPEEREDPPAEQREDLPVQQQGDGGNMVVRRQNPLRLRHPPARLGDAAIIVRPHRGRPAAPARPQNDIIDQPVQRPRGRPRARAVAVPVDVAEAVPAALPAALPADLPANLPNALPVAPVPQVLDLPVLPIPPVEDLLLCPQF